MAVERIKSSNKKIVIKELVLMTFQYQSCNGMVTECFKSHNLRNIRIKDAAYESYLLNEAKKLWIYQQIASGISFLHHYDPAIVGFELLGSQWIYRPSAALYLNYSLEILYLLLVLIPFKATYQQCRIPNLI